MRRSPRLRRPLRATIVGWLAILAVPVVAGAHAAVDPLLASARLQGDFQLAGRITAATHVRGEHKGQMFLRTWTFRSTCPTGPCPKVSLTRRRRTGTDRIALLRTSPGDYQGSGSFYAPLRCGGRVIARGERVPFTVTVTVTAAAAGQFGVFATRVNATYINRRRINRTRCVTVPSSDAAAYHGHLVLPARPPAAPLSDRSPAGS